MYLFEGVTRIKYISWEYNKKKNYMSVTYNWFGSFKIHPKFVSWMSFATISSGMKLKQKWFSHDHGVLYINWLSFITIKHDIKVKNFTWLLLTDNLPMKTWLKEMGVNMLPNCTRCDDVNDLCHVFFDCDKTRAC